MLSRKPPQNLSINILKHYPPYDQSLVDRLLKEELTRDHRKIIVLDDDPTGVQTVHGVSVYTDWTEESIRAGFAEPGKVFFILTNSRSFTVNQTTKVHREISDQIDRISHAMKQEYIIISRGDSTLRGHYPLETETLKTVLEETNKVMMDGEILCPFFAEGGRYTIDNVHYVKYGAELVPSGQTEFAGDKTFGYNSSDLTEYIEEKTAGRFAKDMVTCISLDDLRSLNVDSITAQLMAVTGYHKIVVNAVDEYDLKVFVIALYRALRAGKHFLYRTAAAFVKVIAGISSRPLLQRNEMIRMPEADDASAMHGGLVIIGSHTRKTTAQLEQLQQLPELCCIELNSDLVLQKGQLEAEVLRVVEQCSRMIAAGRTMVVYTRRTLLSLADDTKEAALMRSVKISDAVAAVVGQLTVAPSFVIAKGGITSSDVGTKALQVKHAVVLGQIKPGVPVWQTGTESKFPGIPYIIFPGNVGEDDTLKKAVEVLIR